MMLEILGEVDGRHPTATDLAVYAVAVGKGCLEVVQKFGQDDDSGSRGSLRYGPGLREASSQRVPPSRLTAVVSAAIDSTFCFLHVFHSTEMHE
jgi:hypothetical protein